MKTSRKKAKAKNKNKFFNIAQGRLVVFVCIFAVLGTITLIFTKAAIVVLTSSEGETMQAGAFAAPINDVNASNGQALKYATNGTASTTFNLSTGGSTVIVRARGDQCKGGPSMTVALDNIVLAKSTVGSTYADYSYSKPIASGSHSLTISYSNDYVHKQCNRNLYVDKISFSGNVPDPTPPPPVTTTLWTGDMEETGTYGPRPSDQSQTGSTTLPDFYNPSTGATGNYLGGEYNSGGGTSDRTSAVVHGGTGAAILNLPQYVGNNSGVRLFRWGELRQNRTLNMSGWYYIPKTYTLTGDPNTGKYWILQEFKSTSQDRTRNDPFWYINAYNRSDGSLGAKLAWGYQSRLEGPHQGESGWRNYGDATLPIGRWFKIDMQITQSKDFDGTVSAWIDGNLVTTQTNIRTGWPSCTYNTWCVEQTWALTHYADGLTPYPSSIYIDDATISKP